MTSAVRVDGHRVAVHELGAGPEGPPLVLLHGAGFHARVWDAVAAGVQGVSRTVALDLPGHGRSSQPDGTVRWIELARVVLGALDALRIEQPVVAAHSMGAAIAILAALERPDAFRGMWLFEPVVPPEGVTDAPEGGGRTRRPTFPTRHHAYERYASRPPLDRWHPAVLRSFVDHGFEERDDGTVELLGPADGLHRVTSDWCHHGAMSRLGELRVPVLLAWGAIDHYQAHWVPEIATRIPGVRVEAFDDQSHLGPMEDPATSAASISAFVAGLGVAR